MRAFGWSKHLRSWQHWGWKTTLLQWILGNDFEYVRNDDEEKEEEDDDEDEAPKDAGDLRLVSIEESKLDLRFEIGHWQQSCTTELQRLVMQDAMSNEKPRSFIDTPGFLDTQGKTADVLLKNSIRLYRERGDEVHTPHSLQQIVRR